MADLITTGRAKYNLNNLTTTGGEDSTLAALVSACSRAIRKYCGREFDSQTFDELYTGIGQHNMLLRQFPIVTVSRVAHDPVAVLQVRNTSAANQRATVAVTSTGLTLVRVASGVTSTDTSLAWSGNATLTAVAAAVNSLGNGWSASVLVAEHADRAAADLRPQGAFNVKDSQANLILHVRELASFDIDADMGSLVRSPGCRGWFGGRDYWRVIYTAGYTTVPEDVQEACAEWVAQLFWQSKRDPGLVQDSVPSLVSRSVVRDLPGSIKRLLAPYRTFQV